MLLNALNVFISWLKLYSHVYGKHVYNGLSLPFVNESMVEPFAWKFLKYVFLTLLYLILMRISIGLKLDF